MAVVNAVTSCQGRPDASVLGILPRIPSLQPAAVQITSQTLGSVRVLAISGRVDQAHAKPLEEALAPHLAQCTGDAGPLVLDFSGVDYISSVGLRVLLLAAKQAKTQGGRIAVAALSPMVAEVFRVSRFDLVLSVHATVEAAAAALTP